MPVLKLRNPVAAAPILRKGGVHLKSKTSRRRKLKKDMWEEVTDWKQGKVRT